jgi:hypothetical protein
MNHTLQGSVFTLISTYLLLLPDGKTDTEWEGTPHSLYNWAVSQLPFSYTFTQHSTSILLSEPERHGFTLKMVVTRMSHLEEIRLPLLSPGAGLNLNSGSYQSDEQSSLPLAGSCTSLGSIVHPRPSPRLAGRMNLPSRSNCLLVPGGISSWWSGGMHPGDKRGDNSPSLQSWITSPQEMLRSLLAEIWDS